VFSFWGGNTVAVGAGEGATEPLQLAVRSVIERAAVEMVANLYGMPGPEDCMRFDPLGENVTTGVTGAYIPAYDNLKSNNANTRAEPYRWDGRGDPPPAGQRSDRDARGRYYGEDGDRY
jgi:curli production assembly/transport component CsgG/holdfast attachment protein HfaB